MSSRKSPFAVLTRSSSTSLAGLTAVRPVPRRTLPLAVMDVAPSTTPLMDTPRTIMKSRMLVPRILVWILSPGRMLGVLGDSQQSNPPPWLSSISPRKARFVAKPTTFPLRNTLIRTRALRG